VRPEFSDDEGGIMKSGNEIFEHLFVLELANNHWGSVERGRRIIHDHAAIARKHQTRVAIKLQFRDVDSFIHHEFKGNQDLRYVKKTEATKLSVEEFAALVQEIRDCDCIPMATPFDESSVDLCVFFGMPIIKIASSDINDWPLIERIAATRRPVIASSGGASEIALDRLVEFFEKRDLLLAINHCVSIYPSADHELELNQVDYLKKRYPGHVIGFSTHECTDWHSSMLLSYAKGARTWERHIDIDYEGIPVSPYCSLPENVDTWFSAFAKAVEMCGGSGDVRRVCTHEETEYLDALRRGVYAKTDLPPGYVLTKGALNKEFYMAVPLRKRQLSGREEIDGTRLTRGLRAH
jgi:sialic acid synthase SpsE